MGSSFWMMMAVENQSESQEKTKSRNAVCSYIYYTYGLLLYTGLQHDHARHILATMPPLTAAAAAARETTSSWLNLECNHI